MSYDLYIINYNKYKYIFLRFITSPVQIFFFFFRLVDAQNNMLYFFFFYLIRLYRIRNNKYNNIIGYCRDSVNHNRCRCHRMYFVYIICVYTRALLLLFSAICASYSPVYTRNRDNNNV